MHWAYHPTEKAKIVDANEFYKLLANGWYDSPAKFPAVEKPKEEIKHEIILPPPPDIEELKPGIYEPKIFPSFDEITLEAPKEEVIEENVLRETLEESIPVCAQTETNLGIVGNVPLDGYPDDYADPEANIPQQPKRRGRPPKLL